MSDSKTSRPNIILITSDQHRFDAMSGHGNPHLMSPNLDSYAKSGVDFLKAYSTCPTCIAARRSILTGQTPATHGMVGYEDGVEFFPEHTLPGELGKAGYQTQLVGKFHMFPQRKTYGFDNMMLSDTTPERPGSAAFFHDDYLEYLKTKGITTISGGTTHGHGVANRMGRPFNLEEDLHHTNWCVESARTFLRHRDPTRPFFLHLSFIAPHPPLTPPAVYYDRYKDIDYKPHMGEWVPDFPDEKMSGRPTNAGSGPFHPRELQTGAAGYYGLINHIDDQLDRFFDGFKGIQTVHRFAGAKSSGAEYELENTVCIYTSDHGEMLGDHELSFKAKGYEGSAHIPFFIWQPMGISSRKPVNFGVNRRLTINSPVCLEDIMPTCLDLAGVPIPDTVEGKSLVPALRGESDHIRDWVHGEHKGADHFIVDERYKYIWLYKSNEEQLFDLQEDPHELKDISGDSKLLKTMRDRMQGQLEGREDYTYDISALKPLAGGSPSKMWY